MKKLFYPLSFSSSALKLIALVTMAIDHVGFVFFPDQVIWRIVGRLSFPLFAFFIAEGYRHTNDVGKYSKRLLLFAIISQVPFMLLLHAGAADIFAFNIFFTLAAGLLAVVIISRCRLFDSIIFIVGICVVAEFLKFDYGAYGVLTILASYLFLEKKTFGSVALWLLPFLDTFVQVFKNTSLTQFTAIFSLPFISLYNGEKGFSLPRRLLYWFYPAHILLLWIIWYVIK